VGYVLWAGDCTPGVSHIHVGCGEQKAFAKAVQGRASPEDTVFHLYAIYPDIWEGDRTSSRKGWAEVTKFFLQAYTLFYHSKFNGFKDRWGSGSLERAHKRIRCYSMLARAPEAS
jgi:hypothetical protein